MEVAEMISVNKKLQRTTQIALTLVALSTAHNSWAAGTDSGTSVANRASITYEVAGVAQPLIESSPVGNS
jgi:hypothetical protein